MASPSAAFYSQRAVAVSCCDVYLSLPEVRLTKQRESGVTHLGGARCEQKEQKSINRRCTYAEAPKLTGRVRNDSGASTQHTTKANEVVRGALHIMQNTCVYAAVWYFGWQVYHDALKFTHGNHNSLKMGEKALVR